MIENERQYMTTRRQWCKFNQSILRLMRTPLADIPAALGVSEADLPRAPMGAFLLAECDIKTMELQRDGLQADMDEYDRRVNGDRQGAWFPLFSGRRFWPLDPRPGDIDIKDVAHSLARINRYNGHTRVAYNVAQHAVLVSRILPARYQLFGLMHDAGECYLGDVITPIKRLFRDFYEEAEMKVMKAVAKRYGFLAELLDDRATAIVKRADLVLLETEIRDLTPSGVRNGVCTELPLDEPIGRPWGAKKSERVFLETFERLHGSLEMAA